MRDEGAGEPRISRLNDFGEESDWSARGEDGIGACRECGHLGRCEAREGKAGIAQLVEQLICNQQVVGSSPTAGSTLNSMLKWILRTEQKALWAAVRQLTAHLLPKFYEAIE
jgi:hypothetical protein